MPLTLSLEQFDPGRIDMGGSLNWVNVSRFERFPPGRMNQPTLRRSLASDAGCRLSSSTTPSPAPPLDAAHDSLNTTIKLTPVP